MYHEPGRPTPEAMLERVRREAGAGARGRLHLYLGMAPGVGKTVAMLREGQRRKAAGDDVVIGLVETHGRAGTRDAIGDLELLPRRTIVYKGVTLEELDLPAIMARHPSIVLVDELAHTNAPGSLNAQRWQDVEALLAAGMTVLSTVNIQHLASLADIVESITGVPVRERLPDRIVDEADEVELVDLAPSALRQRLEQGQVYPPERAARARDEFFRVGNLTALRELALRKVSRKVEGDLEAYMREREIDASWPAGERVLVCVAAQPGVARCIRRAWRMSELQRADLLALFVETPAWAHATPEERRALEEAIRLAEDLGAELIRVSGSDVAAVIAQIAHAKNVGSIVLGHSHHGRWHAFWRGSLVNRLLRLLRNVDILVIADR